MDNMKIGIKMANSYGKKLRGLQKEGTKRAHGNLTDILWHSWTGPGFWWSKNIIKMINKMT